MIRTETRQYYWVESQICTFNGNNIQFSTNTISTPHHFFIEVIKSNVELRDTKIDTLIN